jgi:hypothetical protein
MSFRVNYLEMYFSRDDLAAQIEDEGPATALSTADKRGYTPISETTKDTEGNENKR